MQVAMRFSALVAGVLLFATSGAFALQPFDDMDAGPVVTVTEVREDASLVLETGEEAVLEAIEAGPGADSRLKELLLNRPVQLYHPGPAKDRYGRWRGHVVLENDLWVQKGLLEEGLARVSTWADAADGAAELLSAEAEAREAGKGLWALPDYQVFDAADAGGAVGGYQLVEGRVVSAEKVRTRTYLNFGADYRTDFTVAIAGRDRRRFLKVDMDPEQLSGTNVRVRGWVRSFNGPYMELTHPEQLELLDGPALDKAGLDRVADRIDEGVP